MAQWTELTYIFTVNKVLSIVMKKNSRQIVHILQVCQFLWPQQINAIKMCNIIPAIQI